MANLDGDFFGLDDQLLQVFELYPDATPVALRDCPFTSGKPICHVRSFGRDHHAYSCLVV